MVCYGPSKGCKRCRQRKIKVSVTFPFQACHDAILIAGQCDERRPWCRNCEKSKRECPGYDRGDGTISFKDESKNTPKPKRQPSTTSPLREQPFSSSPLSTTQPTGHGKELESTSGFKPFGSVTTSPNAHTDFDMMFIRPDTPAILKLNDFIPLGVPTDPEEQSLSFFLRRFALVADRTEEIWGGFLEVLPALLENAPSKSPLAAATSTTALASIAWTTDRAGQEEFRQHALSKYVTSLKRISEALKDPKQAKSDNLLMAVLMLGFYEVSRISTACFCPLLQVTSLHPSSSSNLL